MKSKILNPKRMKQLIDFKGLELDNGIYPTDIDGLIEYHDSEYILLEVKHKDARVPYGQRLAIQRMVDDFTKAGKKAVAIVCEHKVDDTDKPVVAAFCKVRELYYGGEHKWRPPDSPMNVRQARVKRLCTLKPVTALCRQSSFRMGLHTPMMQPASETAVWAPRTAKRKRKHT